MRMAPSEILRLAAIDGALLGLFMVSVGLFAPLIDGPNSFVAQHVPDATLRRAMVGVAMGLTAMALIYSPWGARSGAHMNPGVTLAFLRLGRIPRTSAIFYICAQVIGGTLGVVAVGLIVGPEFTNDPIKYGATVPGAFGVAAAAGGEFVISLALMLMVLYTSNARRFAPFTGVFAGMLLFFYITFEAPLSGMSINPARTLASAIPSQTFTALWLYLLIPPLAMLLAAEIFRRAPHLPMVHCCKLNHNGHEVCPYCGCNGPIDFDAHKDDSP